MVSSPKAKKYNKILGGGSQELIDREDKMLDRMKKANKRFENDRQVIHENHALKWKVMKNNYCNDFIGKRREEEKTVRKEKH